jgi:hypothetical protein
MRLGRQFSFQYASKFDSLRRVHTPMLASVKFVTTEKLYPDLQIGVWTPPVL